MLCHCTSHHPAEQIPDHEPANIAVRLWYGDHASEADGWDDGSWQLCLCEQMACFSEKCSGDVIIQNKPQRFCREA